MVSKLNKMIENFFSFFRKTLKLFSNYLNHNQNQSEDQIKSSNQFDTKNFPTSLSDNL